MKAPKHIFSLIILALISLIGLQVIWLMFVYQYKEQELKDKTREAADAAIGRLQTEEDSKLILTSIDSLLVDDSLLNAGTRSHIKVMVGHLKDKLMIPKFSGSSEVHKQISIIGNDTSMSTTTIVKIGKDKKKTVTIKSGAFADTILDRKADDLKSLFMKMAVSANTNVSDIGARIDFKHLQKILKEELERKGIYLEPDVTVYFDIDGRSQQVMLTSDLQKQSSPVEPKCAVTLPLFPKDILQNPAKLRVGYLSTSNFLLKQMTGLLAVSLIFSLLIGFIIIYIFRRMLSQEKLHAIKNDFINNMTHELKTPIATISLAVDAIGNSKVKADEEKMNNYTRILKEENKKLNDHVEHVLQMALIEQGELAITKKATDISLLLHSSVKSFQLQAQHQQATIHFNPSQASLITPADEFHLRNAFNNIIDNALKYSGKDAMLNITATTEGGTIVIRFKDNGPGIDASQQQKIFDKFYRIQGGDVHDVKGFGLGLSYVRSIVESHGGTIEVCSEKNKGSEFVIKLRSHAA